MTRAKFRMPSLLMTITILLCACGSSTKTTKVFDESASAGVPYKKVLVVALFDSFENRMYFETELVNQLVAHGVEAVRSTSMMNTLTPVTRQTFVDMVDKISADAVLISHLESVDSSVKIKDMRPEATYNIWPTYYFNVWNVELTEYVEPQSVALGHNIVLATQVFSVQTKKPVWAIETSFKIQQGVDQIWDYDLFTKEAKPIVNEMSHDRLIGN